MTRRERTRRLIDLGGLVVQSGLADLLEDDRILLHGALLSLVATLRSSERERVIARWRQLAEAAAREKSDVVPPSSPQS